MKRFLLPAIIAFVLCLIPSPVQAAVQVTDPAIQPAFSFVDSIRDFLSDPNVAYLFFTLAILGLLIEIITPGFYLPGIIGVIAAVLAFYAIGTLSVNPVGVALIIVALPIFVLGAYRAAAFIPSTIAGIAALIAGSLCLFHDGPSIHPALIAAVVIIMSVAFILGSNRAVKAQRLRVSAGPEDLISRIAAVRTSLEPEGTVMVEGELWQAELDNGQAQVGEEVIVTAIHGLKLVVTKKNKEVPK
ncbi:MAG: hypothetical protein FWH51_00860 [Dehalococcoidia bacterium]|nr:hypothetical protein [Dehalococcoidia bacterium]